MKKALSIIFGILFLNGPLISQSITSYSTTIFPNTDSATVLQDTITVNINSESGTVNFISSVGMVTYRILTVERAEHSVRYYLKGDIPGKGIYYVEVWNDRHRPYLFVSYEMKPEQPILLNNCH